VIKLESARKVKKRKGSEIRSKVRLIRTVGGEERRTQIGCELSLATKSVVAVGSALGVMAKADFPEDGLDEGNRVRYPSGESISVGMLYCTNFGPVAIPQILGERRTLMSFVDQKLRLIRVGGKGLDGKAPHGNASSRPSAI